MTNLSDRLAEDDAFFASVRQLILCGNTCSPEQRQIIIDELRRQDEARQAREAQERAKAAVQGKVSGSSPRTTRPSPSSTTTTTSPPPPPSSPPPSSPPPPPPASVCVGSTCVTVPSTLPHFP